MSLPALQSTSPVSLYEPQSDYTLRLCESGSSRGFNGKLQLLNVPSTSQRATLMKRHNELMTGIGECNRKTVGAAIGEMLMCYPKFNSGKPLTRDEDKAWREVLAKYVQELQSLPTWACVKACDAIRFGTSGLSTTFPPSTIEVRILADSYLVPIRAELARIADVLQGEQAIRELSTEEKMVMGMKMRGLHQELESSKKERFDAVRKEVNKAWAPKLERQRENFIRREYGAAAVIECAPGLPISKGLFFSINARDSGRV